MIDVTKHRLSLVAPLLYMMALLGLSSMAGTIPDEARGTYRIVVWLPPGLQNLLHVPAYAGLAFLWHWSLKARLRPALVPIAAFLFTMAYSISEEWYQSFVPGRYASLTDVLLDCIGACVGVLAFRWASRAVARRSTDAD